LAGPGSPDRECVVGGWPGQVVGTGEPVVGGWPGQVVGTGEPVVDWLGCHGSLSLLLHRSPTRSAPYSS
jgi:hypothetical protein